VYFNQGMAALITLTTATLFKDHYKLDPGKVQVLLSIISAPWTIKIVYGWISDNIPIFGSRRKSYIIICSILQFTALMLMSLFSDTDYRLAVFLLTVTSMTGATIDVISDSLIVI